MNRRLTAVFAALEALLALGIGVGIPLLVATIMWAVQYGLQLDWMIFYRGAIDAWALGHGVPLDVHLDRALQGVFGVSDSQAGFPVSIAPLGIAAVTFAIGYRAGRRIAETPHPVVGGVTSVLTVAVLGGILVGTATHEGAVLAVPAAFMLPALVFTTGLLSGGLQHAIAGGAMDPVSRQWRRIPPDVRDVTETVLRSGLMAFVALVGIAALVVTGLIVVNFSTVTGLYQALQPGYVGVIALTVLSLALVPNLVVWMLSWLAGAGFSLGQGSSVSPLGTDVGPIPALPILGAIPKDAPLFSLVALLIPAAVAFGAGLVARRRTTEVAERAARPWTVTLSVVLGITVVVVVLAGLVAWCGSGAAGPGRLSDVGVNPGRLMLFLGVETLIGGTLALFLPGAREAAAGLQSAAKTAGQRAQATAGRLAESGRRAVSERGSHRAQPGREVSDSDGDGDREKPLEHDVDNTDTAPVTGITR